LYSSYSNNVMMRMEN